MSLLPSFSLSRLSLRMPAITGFALLVYILFYSNLINLGNYSFLMYSFSGTPISHPALDLLKYSRLPILIFGVLVSVTLASKYEGLKYFYIRNFDIFLFAVFIYLGLINAIDLFTGLLYSFWHSAAFICILTTYFMLFRMYSTSEALRFFFQFLFWSNVIVLPFLFLNLGALGQEWNYDMAFSSKAFYPYCLLTMMISIYCSRLFTSTSIFDLRRSINFTLEVCLVAAIFFFCFFSARRTPLFMMVLLSTIYMYFAFGKRIWKRVLLLLISMSFVIYSIPKALRYIEAHKYELSILKKLDDLQRSTSGLRGDASYNARLIVWNMYFQISRKFPVVGTGSYNSSLHSLKDFDGHEYAGYSTHNLYLGVIVEHGIVGFMIFIFILLRGIWLAFSRLLWRHFCYYLIFLLFPVLVINWNEYNFIPGQGFYWTTIMVILLPRYLIVTKAQVTL